MTEEEKIQQFLNIRHRLKPPLNLESCALLVIDMQEYQVRGDGSIGRLFDKLVPGMLKYYVERTEELVIPNIKLVLNLFHENNLPVYFTKFATKRTDGRDLTGGIREQNKLAMNLIGEPIFPHEQEPSASIIPELSPKGSDVVLIKTTSGTFSSTDIDHQLKNLGIETVIIVGVVTHFCVENTARIAADLGYNVIVIDDACAAWSPDLHEAALRVMDLFFISILQTKRILKQLERKIKKLTK
jgi:nicotinamidase-related amidase